MEEMKPRVFAGDLVGAGLRFGIVVSRFNNFITQRLLEGALDGFQRHGVESGGVDVAWTPGSFELPLVADRMAKSGQYNAICCLACVIRGGTAHFDLIAGQVARGVAQASWTTGVPITFGVLTTETVDQAIERAGTKAGNKGFDAAVSSIEMAQLLRCLPTQET